MKGLNIAKHMLTILIIINIIINIFFLGLFELKRPAVRDFLPLVVICAAASLGRVIFSFIPQVQPVTVLVIITGSAYGCLYGYVTGSLCAVISNMMLGQGPWTLFQMTAWGTVGFLAGALGHLFRKDRYTIDTGSIDISNFCKPYNAVKYTLLYKKEKGFAELAAFFIYAFLSAFLFSIITDTLTISYLNEALTLSSAIAVFATGIAFNVSHAIFNAVLILLLYKPVKRSLLKCRSAAQ